jgi:hypothetical protein
MSRIPFGWVSLTVPAWLLAPAFGLAGDSAPTKSPCNEKPDGQRVRQYMKQWTDDYYNYHKEVYLAYTKTIREKNGDEVTVEIRHGKAAGFHKNGRNAWEGVYCHGKRQGEFTTQSKDGARVGLANFERGQLQGTRTEWAEDGTKFREDTYEKGKLDGEARWWDRDGKLLTAGTNRNDKPWSGTFPELKSPPDEASFWVIRRYEKGQLVSEEKLKGNWWW